MFCVFILQITETILSLLTVALHTIMPTVSYMLQQKNKNTLSDVKYFMYTVHEFHRLVQKHIELKLSENKTITFSQFMVLACFACQTETSFSQEKIAECSNISEATVSKHITSLVGLGLLAKEENKENRRKFSITITKKGINAFKKAENKIENELHTLLANIPEIKRKSIETTLSSVIKTLTTKE